MSSMNEVITNCDLLTKILLRLPVKSLLRFKSVSKHWHSVITDARFVTLHKPDLNYVSGLFLNVPSCYGLLSWNEYTDTLNPSLNFIPLENDKSSIDVSHVESIKLIPKLSGMIILNSCNGLLLCLGYIEAEDIGGYHVLNPTTKQFETLPDPRHDTRLNKLEGLGLAYDPSRSHHFKVVCISSAPGTLQDTFQIEIYSSETKTWRASGGRFTTNALRMYLSNGVYWNGAINWLDSEPLYFNVDEERVGFMPVPSISVGTFWNLHYYFGESNGHLYFVDFYGPTTQFNVYEMKRDYSAWFVKYRVDLAAIATEFPEMTVPGWNCHCSYSVTYILRGKDNDGGSFMVLYIPGKFLRYNFVDGSYEIICEYEDSNTLPGEDGHLLAAYPYTESLFPLPCCQKRSPTLPSDKSRGRSGPSYRSRQGGTITMSNRGVPWINI